MMPSDTERLRASPREGAPACAGRTPAPGPFAVRPLRLRWLTIWAGTFVLVLACLLLAGAGLNAVLPPEERAAAERLLAAAGAFPALIVMMLLAATAMLAAWLTRAYFAPIVRAAEQARIAGSANPAARLDERGPRELRALAQAVNALAAALERLAEDDRQRIAEARADSERERHRLAALMAELTQGVVVCNAEGRILLYNERARSLLAAEPASGERAAATGYMGIGRSLYGLMSRESVEHALTRLRARLAAGADDPGATFTTTLAGGAMLRARVAPIASIADTGAQPPDAGFVLLLEDLSREVSELEHRDALLADLIQQSRGALASLRAATENLNAQPDMPAAQRARFLAIAEDELRRLTQLVERSGSDHAARMSRRPDLEPMRAAELLEAIAGRVRAIEGIAVAVGPADASAWVQVDSLALVQVVRALARRLLREHGQRTLALRSVSEGEFVYLDVAWDGVGLDAATVRAWEEAPAAAAAGASEPTVRDLIARNRAEIWHEAEPGASRARFRIMLRSIGAEPIARRAMPLGRPMYYDFDLFQQSGRDRALDDAPLTALAYTAFDTETTGLDPSAGDEIVSIGAVRIVNGRLLRGETFDQLVDPKRPIAREAMKIHGIRPSMVAGQPEIGAVLPAFHRFCEDTVLLGHNAAFDMRFLQMKEGATGLRFDHPVLDTLLLSALLYESAEDHRLEAIAQRLGVDVMARHTALGDAIMVAEVFLRMLPLLAARGIATLRQAREASERTYYAKLRY